MDAGKHDMDLTVTQSTLTTSGWVDSAIFGFADGSGTVSIDLDQVILTAAGRTNNAIYANKRGSGAVDIDITGGTITASGAMTRRGIRATHQGTGGIDINIDGGAVIKTTGASRASAIWARIQDTRPANAGTIRIRMKGGSLSTTGTRAGIGLGSETTYSYGVGALHENAGGLIDIGLDSVTVTTTGDYSSAVHGEHRHSGGGAIAVGLTSSTLSTAGTGAHGVSALTRRGAVDIDVTGGLITTEGATAHGVWARNTGSAGAVDITLLDGAVVKTSGTGAHGVWGQLTHGSNAAALTVSVTGGSVTTSGAGGHGVFADQRGTGGVDVDLTGGSIATMGAGGHGVYGVTRPVNTGGISIDLAAGVAVSTSGADSHGVYALHLGASGAVTVGATGGSVTTSGANSHAVHVDRAGTGDAGITLTGVAIAAEGRGAHGVRAYHSGSGSTRLTIGTGTKVEAPFAIGVEALLTSPANADGRLIVRHGGTIEARDAGILAWAARRSGHTFGAGAQDADDAARTEPMVHVTSSGDVTVGEAAADAFIRTAIAGDDGALSVEEKAVFDAIVAENSDVLTTALAELPGADYDAAWKARANALLTSRAHEPTTFTALRNRAAEEIMGLTRSGIRALALPYKYFAYLVSNGDGDEALTDDERTVLAAALTGGDLEAALAALPGADYNAAWKNSVRELAASYNAGDVLVDVTGGTITAEGDGVDARYTMTHDQNSAIAVSVAKGATVTGGRHGIHVGGAGLVAGNDDLRDQTVTVNGAVMGGTGAGVHLAGGGTVTVGSTGRVGATSGDGILSEGAGDLVATVHGTVQGDIRAMGGGALTLAVMEGGSVTGTVHDPAGPVTVRGSVGRLLYGNGGAVTVAATGRITGVEGETDGIRSDAGALSVMVAGAVEGDIRALGGGDLDATISGTVAGDLLAQGGALTLNLMEGSAITGTVHDPVGPLTLRASSIGRLLYTNGGTVTVAATGRLTGVDGETAAIQSEAGDLAVTVAGTVQGDIRAMGGGDLTATISGRVDGDLLAQGGTLRLNLMEGSAVTGTVHDPVGPLTLRDSSIGRLLYTTGGTVTVSGTGRLTGVVVEGGSEAIRSEAGDLTLSVAAMGSVTGDVIAEGDGDLSAMVAGTLTGDLVEEGAGDLDATISGRVEGDVFGRGTGEHTVTVSKSGTVTGTVHLAGSTVTVGGTVGRVTLENRGMVTVAQTGRVTGVPGGHGVEVGAGSTVTNRGTIAGKVGIRAGAGSTVVNYGTIRSTDGAEGIAVAFQPGQNTLTLHPGMTIIGKIQGLTGDDTVDLSNLEVSEVGLLTFVDETNTPRTPARIMRPRGVGRVINVGGALVGLDTTAFALTDDMLSDLTGSIHAAVVGTGRSAQPRAGTSAPGYVWATPFGGARNQDGTDTLGAGTHSFGGGLFGAGWGGDALHLGGFLGGSTGRLDVDNSQDVDVQTVFGGVYAQQARGAMRLDARLVLGHMEHDSTRRVGRSTATAEYTAIFFSPEAGLATRLPVTSTLHATPRLRVRYAGLFTEGFRERGTNWDLRVAERAVQILEVRGAVGVPIAVAGGGRLEPRVGLEGRWLLAGEKVEVSLPGGAFRVAAGGDTGVGTGTVGFGLTLPVAAATTLVGNFDGALTTEEAWRATGYLSLTYSF